MITSSEVKQFLKKELRLKTVKVSTVKSKAGWIQTYIPTDKGYRDSFPDKFRRVCLQIIYGKDSETDKQSTGGNINLYSIHMIPSQWEEAINQWRNS